MERTARILVDGARAAAYNPRRSDFRHFNYGLVRMPGDPMKVAHEFPSAVDWLRSEFVRRRTTNPAYSLRSFARFLQLSSGSLSEIMSRKRKLTTTQATKIVERLKLDPETGKSFIALVKAAKTDREMATAAPSKDGPRYKQIDDDAFHIISDWYHFAILSLMSTKSFRSDVTWISRRLGISITEVRIAVERLLRLGYIAVDDDGWRLAEAHLATSTDIPSAAIRRSHVQSLQQVIDYIDIIDPKDRDVSSITVAVNKEKLPVAKELIRNFRRLLADFLEAGPRDEVYNLNIQLMPVSGVRQ